MDSDRLHQHLCANIFLKITYLVDSNLYVVAVWERDDCQTGQPCGDWQGWWTLQGSVLWNHDEPLWKPFHHERTGS